MEFFWSYLLYKLCFPAKLIIKTKQNSNYKNKLNLKTDLQVAVLQLESKINNKKSCSITLLSPKVVE
jgi:hypothetical protein